MTKLEALKEKLYEKIVESERIHAAFDAAYNRVEKSEAMRHKAIKDNDFRLAVSLTMERADAIIDEFTAEKPDKIRMELAEIEAQIIQARLEERGIPCPPTLAKQIDKTIADVNNPGHIDN